MWLSVFPAQDSENCLKQGDIFFIASLCQLGTWLRKTAICFVNLSPVATCTSAQEGIRCTWLQNNQ